MSNETGTLIQKYSLIIVVIGIAILLVGVIKLGLNASFVNRAVATEGTVLEVVYRSPEVEYDVGDYMTKVEFRTSEGQLIRFTQPFSEVHVGDTVQVLYNLSNPSEVRIYGAWQFWGWWTLIASNGAVIFIIGLWGWLGRRKLQKEP
jgi:hypothetical protein